MSQRNPFAQSLVYRNVPDTFKTTYGQSYTKVPTVEVSPAFEEFRNRDFEKYSYFPRDLSPYPDTRDPNPFRNPRPYQPEPEPSYNKNIDGSATYRSRFEEATLRRDEYNETLPSRPREPPYEREFEMNGDYRRERGRATDRGRQNGTRYPADKAEKMLAQFDDLVADGQELNPEELTKAVCNKCYNSNMCMNRLGCGHQYCDDCMARMPGSDGPFRDTVRWYFSCPLDNKRTSEAKVVRTDPFGRRLMKFHDVGYFKTT